MVLAATVIEDFNEDSDDLAVSPKPNALILFNPIVNLGKDGFGFKDIGKLSPYHRLSNPLPPTIIFHGTEDKVVPFASIQAFAAKARHAGSKEVTVVPYEGRGHAFFNVTQKTSSQDDYSATMQEMGKFLGRIGWIE